VKVECPGELLERFAAALAAVEGRSSSEKLLR